MFTERIALPRNAILIKCYDFECLAVMALCKTILSFIGLYPDCDVAEAWQLENFLRFCRPRQGYIKRWWFMVFDSSGDDGRVTVVCLKLMTSKPRLTSPSDVSYAGVFCGKWPITAFMGFSDLG
jgi:hypothetical protein